MCVLEGVVKSDLTVSTLKWSVCSIWLTLCRSCNEWKDSIQVCVHFMSQITYTLALPSLSPLLVNVWKHLHNMFTVCILCEGGGHIAVCAVSNTHRMWLSNVLPPNFQHFVCVCVCVCVCLFHLFVVFFGTVIHKTYIFSISFRKIFNRAVLTVCGFWRGGQFTVLVWVHTNKLGWVGDVFSQETFWNGGSLRGITSGGVSGQILHTCIVRRGGWCVIPLKFSGN